MALIQTIADTFEVSDCWICGGPQLLSQWPWVAVPLSPVWILSNRSVVHDRTRFWTSQEKHQGSLSKSVPGEHCLNQTGPELQETWLGESNCKWTFTQRPETLAPIDCAQYANRWDQNGITCSDGRVIPCTHSYFPPSSYEEREQKGNITEVVGISFTTPLIPENHVKGVTTMTICGDIYI